jgi:hypothetical protein
MLDRDAVLRLDLHRRVPHRFLRIAARLRGRRFLDSRLIADGVDVGRVLLGVVGELD